MSNKPYRPHDRFFTGLIVLLCCCAVILIAALAVQSKLSSTETTVVQVVSTIDPSATTETLTLYAEDSSLNATAEAETDATEEPTATPSATEEPFEYLPVYTKGDTNEKIIALTLDEISNVTALATAVEAAESYGAKLTLFPYGSTILTTDVTEALRVCVLELGYEVENRTQNNLNLYQLSDDDMAMEILTPDITLDYILDMDYGMHLLRPYGAQGTNDPRTHAYLKKLGYDGFVTWTVDGTNATVDELKETLEPGNIYMFECTTESVEKMVAFMEYVTNLGYTMVTVNEVLGFEENTCEELTESILTKEYPMPDTYELMDIEFSNGDRAWQVVLIQERLAELGYMSSDDVDGIFGDGTTSAIMQFQAALDLPCTGVATIELQNLLFADDAPQADPTAAPTVESDSDESEVTATLTEAPLEAEE